VKKTFSLFYLFTFFIFISPDFVSAQSVNLPVPAYEQGNSSAWADEKMGSKSELTIRTHGCALTCISMVISYFSGKEVNPSEMNSWLVNNRGYQDAWEGDLFLGSVKLNWPALSAYGKGYVYTRHDWKADPADIVLIQYYLDKGKPVIAEVIYRGAPHYVVLTGYDKEGFTMNDPEFPDEHLFNSLYNISDKWGSGPSRNIYGIRVLYPPE